MLSIPWVEMHYTTDDWATSRVCKSSDVPSPVINGWYITFDNNLFPNASPVLNTFGVAFYTAGGATWNIFSSGNQYELFTNSIPGNVDKIGALSVTAVPEPESYAMMLAGLALMGTIVRRRKSKTA